jgi:hypothetical protein
MFYIPSPLLPDIATAEEYEGANALAYDWSKGRIQTLWHLSKSARCIRQTDAEGVEKICS